MKKVVNKTVNLDLVGVNGNALRHYGCLSKTSSTQEEIDLVLNEAKSNDYDYLLATIEKHCKVEDEPFNSENNDY